MLRRIIGPDVDVVVQLSPELPAVIADPVQVEQVIVNLAVNARDAMPNGGQLTIETCERTLDREYCVENPWARPGRFVEIAVVDQGEGMDAEGLRRIFEPFYTTKEPGKGTGLGLSVVYGIVKQHSGLIYVSSRLSEGTTFKVYLPVDEGPVEEALLLSEKPLRGGTETILVAEDEEALLKLNSQFLTDLGYTVLKARDGYEALKLFEANQDKIDLLLLDLLMPRVSGREVFERIRATGSSVPTIFFTGYAPEAMRRAFIENLKSPLIQKPFGIADLGRKVREVLDSALFAESGQPPAAESTKAQALGAKRSERAARKSNFLGKGG
jgi:CheY-like chemotaxis protein